MYSVPGLNGHGFLDILNCQRCKSCLFATVQQDMIPLIPSPKPCLSHAISSPRCAIQAFFVLRIRKSRMPRCLEMETSRNMHITWIQGIELMGVDCKIYTSFRSIHFILCHDQTPDSMTIDIVYIHLAWWDHKNTFSRSHNHSQDHALPRCFLPHCTSTPFMTSFFHWSADGVSKRMPQRFFECFCWTVMVKRVWVLFEDSLWFCLEPLMGWSLMLYLSELHRFVTIHLKPVGVTFGDSPHGGAIRSGHNSLRLIWFT